MVTALPTLAMVSNPSTNSAMMRKMRQLSGVSAEVESGMMGEDRRLERSDTMASGMNLRHEAMLMLDKRGAVLATAVKVSRVMRERGIDGAVIGGVAVVLHGHIRTT